MKREGIYIGFALIAALATSLFPIYTARATETLEWSGSVSSDGTTVTTLPLQLGVYHRIEVSSGVMYLGSGAFADAEYYAVNPPNAWVWPNGTRPDGHSFLQIDDQDVEWGAFSNGQPGYPPYLGHDYEAFYVGQGVPIEFSIHDWIDGLSAGNSCHLEIVIWSSPSGGPGFTPGFWKHNISVALDLSNGAYSSFVEDGTPITYGQLVGWVTTAGYDLNSALAALSASGPGSEDVRANCANAINTAAGFGPFVDSD